MDADVVRDDIPALADLLAGVFEGDSGAALADRNVFTVALSGGSVATELYPRLSAASVDWDRVEFFWVDERAVPPASPESNYGLTAALWLWPAGVPAERIHRMPADDPDLGRAAGRYSAHLERVAGRPPQLDLAIIGVGPDGHVASLFPGHPALEAKAVVTAVDDAPKPPPRRLTLTLPVIAAARRVVIAAFGDSKAAVISAALEDPESTLPIARLTRMARRPLFLLDRPAAGRLSAAG